MDTSLFYLMLMCLVPVIPMVSFAIYKWDGQET